ncbi:MAG: permease-like cell division protein FtsX [Clostridiales bacterium]|jgi:cell division transport system permease protein|nr:permease-like cell division protein FtsX [Clostridiales bacterium]
MKIKNIAYFISEAFRNIFSNGFMSLTSIFSVMISITIFGMFVVLNSNLDSFTKQIQDFCKIRVYFPRDLNEHYVEKAKKNIETINKVKNIELISKKKALEECKEKIFKGRYNLIKAFEYDNPLRDCYKVTLTNAKFVEEISKEIENIENVEEVKYEKNFINNILKLIIFLKYSSLVLVIFFGTISILIISNSIKIMLFIRRKEINIMKFIGATNWFIKWPYIIEGAVIGAIGSALACVLIFFGYSYIISHAKFLLEFTKFKTLNEIFSDTFLKLFYFGSGIGIIGSYISIKKYLHV